MCAFGPSFGDNGWGDDGDIINYEPVPSDRKSIYRCDLVDARLFGGRVLASLDYPGLDEWGGRRVLCFDDALALRQKVAGGHEPSLYLDPRFREGGPLDLTARFEPSEPVVLAARCSIDPTFFPSGSGEADMPGLENFTDPNTTSYAEMLMGMLNLFSDVEPDGGRPIRMGDGSPAYACRVLVTEEVGGMVIADLEYDHADNYSGRKLLVYDEPEQFREQVDLRSPDLYLDPHFIEDDDVLSPVARFEPTERGLAMARKFCKSMSKMGGREG